MRCLVVGGSGQDGILVSAQLLAEGHDVVSLSRSPPPLTAVDRRIADVTAHDTIDKIVADVRPDEVYYLTAFHRSSESERPSLDSDVAGSLAVNVAAFAAMLASLTRHAPAARIVYASSCRVFGLGDGQLLDESAPLLPCK